MAAVSLLESLLTTPSARIAAIQTAREFCSQKPIFLDTETTGLDSNAEIVEIVVLDSDGSTLMNSLVHPRSPIPPESSRIHGITDEMIQNAPAWISLWQELRGIFFGRLLAIYNAEFDLRMIDQTNRKSGLIRWKPGLPPADIMRIFADYRSVWDPSRNANRFFRLEEAGRFFGIEIPNSHRALDDTLLAREVLYKIADSFL